MKKTNETVALLLGPKEGRCDISWRAGNMFLNRMCIDEDAAFETQGIYFIESFHDSEPSDNDKVYEPVRKRKRKLEGRSRKIFQKSVFVINLCNCILSVIILLQRHSR